MSGLNPAMPIDQGTFNVTGVITTPNTVDIRATPHVEMYNDGAVNVFLRWAPVAAPLVATVPSGATGGSYLLAPGQTKVITLPDATVPYRFSAITASGSAVVYLSCINGE